MTLFFKNKLLEIIKESPLNSEEICAKIKSKGMDSLTVEYVNDALQDAGLKKLIEFSTSTNKYYLKNNVYSQVNSTSIDSFHPEIASYVSQYLEIQDSIKRMFNSDIDLRPKEFLQIILERKKELKQLVNELVTKSKTVLIDVDELKPYFELEHYLQLKNNCSDKISNEENETTHQVIIEGLKPTEDQATTKTKDPSQITDESLQLNQLFLHGLFSSLFYDEIPSPKEIELEIDTYSSRLLNKAQELNVNVSKSISKVKESIAENDDWRIIYNLLIEDIDLNTLEPNEKLKQIYSWAQTPFKSFLSLIESVKSDINFSDNKKFSHIVNEICRDNVVTEVERNYLFEKAEIHGVDKNKVELYINNEFRNCPSFVPLIDEICEDGIITDAEWEYINEKAKFYKIDATTLDKLIKIGLLRVNTLNLIKTNSHFRRIIVLYFIVRELTPKSPLLLEINNFIVSMDSLESTYAVNEKLIEEYDRVLVNTQTIVESMLLGGLKGNGFNYEELIELLGIDLKHFNFENQVENAIHESVNKVIRINDKEFVTRKFHAAFHPLYKFEFENLTGNNVISINTAHPSYKESAEKPLLDVACSMYYSKLSMTDPNNSKYVNRIINHIDLIEYE